ncbi:unnamed protein product [Taenia asiatica]|uniref:Secreted protein n=1 Tax=Taenia asiatica TaxID=60517 RepID=A0A0R3WEH6_TAEAS|nr:unnamed protein product [Taenia asiatica]
MLNPLLILILQKVFLQAIPRQSRDACSVPRRQKNAGQCIGMLQSDKFAREAFYSRPLLSHRPAKSPPHPV